MTTVSVDYYGMSGEGRNVTEAKRNASTKIVAALSGDYTPEIIAWRDCAALLFRTPAGWKYRHILDSGKVRAGKVFGNSIFSGADYDEAREYVRGIVAQTALSADDDLTDLPDFPLTRQQLSDLASRIGFWRAHRKATADGLVDCEAHAWACAHQGEFLPTKRAA